MDRIASLMDGIIQLILIHIHFASDIYSFLYRMLIFMFTRGYIMFSNRSVMFEIIDETFLQIFISLKVEIDGITRSYPTCITSMLYSSYIRYLLRENSFLYYN